MTLRRIARYLPFVVLCGLLAGGVTYAVARNRVTYTAGATIAVSPNDAALQLIQGSTSTAQVDVATYVASQVPYLTSQTVLEQANGIVESQYRRPLASVSASADQVGQTLSVTASSSDRKVAVASANAVLRAYELSRSGAQSRLLSSAIASLGRQITSIQASLKALDSQSSKSASAKQRAAAVRYQQAYDQRQNLIAQSGVSQGGFASIESATLGGAAPSATGKLGLLGFVLGALIAAFIALVREQAVGTVRGARDVTNLTPVMALAQLPRVGQRERGSTNRGYVADTALAESLRRLRVGLRLLMLKPPRSVLVASADRTEGRTFVAANLATSWAATGRRVLLVASDLRKPDVGALVGRPEAAPGLTDLLARAAQGTAVELSESEIDGAVQHTEADGLSLLATGTGLDDPMNLLETSALGELISILADRWDIVIFDSPPLLLYGDAALLARLVDAVVIVATVDRTRKSRLRSALDILLTSGIGNVFTVVNRDGGDPAGFADPGTTQARSEWVSENSGPLS